jgi:dipeptidyl aminopeptidase/acylaminoacyl peptidase
VVHRDIKPENIIFLEGEPMLADFGIALAVKEAGGDRLTQTGLSLGTPQYMSPEQATGERALDARSDVYSLAAVLYEMLTGDPPVTGATAQAIIAKLMTERPTGIRVVRETVPEAVEAMVFKGLAKTPADRPASAAAFASGLDTAMSASPVHGGRSAPKWAIAGGASLVLVAAAIMMWVGRGAVDDGAGTVPPDLDPGQQVSFVGNVGKFALAPDDRTVAYFTPDQQRVELLDIDGGGTQTLYTAPSGTVLEDLQWSADGSRLYLTVFPRGNRIFSIPRLGGTPREELQFPNLISLNGHSVRALDEGRWLVTGSSNTFHIGNDQTGLRAVGTRLEGPGTFTIPSVTSVTPSMATPSPDGAWLAFSGVDSAARAIGGIVSLRPGTLGQIAMQWPDLIPVGWSADGRMLVVQRPVADGISDLLRVEFDPAAGRARGAPVLFYPRLVADAITLSTKGDRIVYVTGAKVTNLREIALDGTPALDDNPVRMVTQGTATWVMGLFLPGGDVLGIQHRNGRLEARRFDAAGRSEVLLQRPDTAMRLSHAISNDGRLLALATQDTAGVVTLNLHEMGTARVRRIPLPLGPSRLAWSADDRFLAAMTMTSADQIMVVDVVAEQAKLVTLQCGTRCEFAWENVAVGDAWPLVAITSEVDTWIANVETGALRHLVENTWYVNGWINDWIYFIRAGGQTEYPGMTLYRIPVAGGVEQHILNLPLDCDLESNVSLSPDGARLLCVVNQSQRDLHVIANLGVPR